jgi:hypothetical protein
MSYTNTTGVTQTVSCCLFTNSTGTVYMDCVQFEQSATASRYNLVENGNFIYSGTPAASWSGTNLATADTIAETATGAPQLENHAFCITGDPTKTKQLTQTVNVSGSAGDSFVLAGWAKGHSVPLENGGTRKFAVRARFNYTDSKDFEAEFNTAVDSWQYAAVAM